MATLKLIGFSGEVPKVIPRMLPKMHAQRAFNTRLDDGGLTPIRKSRLEHAFSGGSGDNYQTIYRHNSTWLGWDNEVNAAPGPVDTDRLYYTGDGVPKMREGGTVYDLKVPYPTTKPSTSKSGTGSGDTFTRIYVYTWVTAYGEESLPSLASDEIDWQSGETVTLSNIEAVPAGRNITKMRFYRSQSGIDAGSGLFLIEERAASNSDYDDTVPPDEIQEPLPSNNYHQPPDDLEGLIALPNGMMAAFRGKELCFCEPYRPHAWPEEYRLTTSYEIMALGAFGSTMVVATKGVPYIVEGTHPANMVMEKSELNLPCINKRSIQDLGYSIAYASPDGLVEVSSAGARLATMQTMSRDDWLLLNPESFVAGQFKRRYYASYNYVDDNNNEQKGTIIIDLSGQQPFIIRTNTYAEAFWYDLSAGKLFFLEGGGVYEWDAEGEANESQSWISPEFIMAAPTNFGAIMIEANAGLTPEEEEALQAEIDQIKADNLAKIAAGDIGGAVNAAEVNAYPVNGDDLEPIPDGARQMIMAVFADGEHVISIDTVNKVYRLPSGFLARKWYFEIGGNMPVEQVSIAGTAMELRNV